MKKLLFTLSSVILATSVFAQIQRVQLYEEFTSENEPKCADVNPVLQNLLDANTNKLVYVKYHSPFPSGGTLYSQSKASVDSRVQYYSITSTPMGVHDGQQKAYPLSFLQDSINAHNDLQSPVKLNLTHYITNSGDSFYVNVEIIALVQTIAPSLKLKLAVVEKQIQYATAPGTNGERFFTNVMRTMLPSASGNDIKDTLNVNDTIKFKLGWKIANVNDISKVAGVAFLQDDANQLVIQAGMSQGSLIANITHQPIKTVDFAGTDTASIFNTVFNVSANTTYDYRVALNKAGLPSGWKAYFTISGVRYDDSTVVTLNSNGSVSPIVTIVNDSTANQKADVVLSVRNLSVLTNYKVALPLTSYTAIENLILDKTTANSLTYTSAIGNVGQSTMVTALDDINNADTAGLSKNTVKHIFINTGELYRQQFILTDNEIDALIAYLKDSGKVFISGQDISYAGFDVNASSSSSKYKNFINNYLGAYYSSDGNNLDVNISTNASDLLYGDKGLPATKMTGAPNITFPDHLTVNSFLPNAIPVILYNDNSAPSNIAAIRNNDGIYDWKLVYVAFSFNRIADNNFINDFINYTIQWFDGVLLGIKDLSGKDYKVEVFPNPAFEHFAIKTVGLKQASLIIVDLQGKQILKQALSVDSDHTLIGVSHLNEGIYFYQILSENKPIITNKIIIAK